MAEETMINTEGQNATTAETEEKGRMFTQDEVNAIIRDRLTRERAKSPVDEREQALSARESKLDCREYIAGKKYPAALLDIFSTDDTEAFKVSVDKLIEAFPAIVGEERPAGTGSIGNFPRNRNHISDPVAEAFKPQK